MGALIDPILNWSLHIENLRLELRLNLGLFYLASPCLPLKALILLYSSLINSKLVYCLEVFGNALKTYLNKLYIIQKKLMRVVFHKGALYHSAPFFKLAKVLPIHQLYLLRIGILTWRTYSQSDPVPTYETLFSKLSLPVPAATSSCGQCRVQYQMARIWNNFPTHLREIRCFAEYRVAFKQYLLEQIQQNLTIPSLPASLTMTSPTLLN